jgi:hypothetical protein
MSKTEIAKVLRSVIADCLHRSGREVPEIGSDMKIIDGFPGFDSLCGLEATIELELRRGFSLEDNVFIKEVQGRPRARTFGEVVNALLAVANGGSNGGE